jgi:cell division protein ZapA (FtsZ GTPase activity inhibitor)
MASVAINGKEFDLDSMSEESKAILVSIQFVDNELKRLKASEAALKVARASYSVALSTALDLKTEEHDSGEGIPESISFD